MKLLKELIDQNSGIRVIEKVLRHLANHGNVLEALRQAHLIGSAVMSGQSGKRA